MAKVLDFKIKLKTCVMCKNEFKPYSTLTRTCSIPCALDWAIRNREKKEEKDARKELKEGRDSLKTKSDWEKDAQKQFNRWIRARDNGNDCISCGKSINELKIKSNIVMVCGHFLSVGAHCELRFTPDNANLQCTRCNGGAGKYGNFNNKQETVTQSYRIRLIEKIGIDRVALLEGPHVAKKYSIDELKEIKQGFSEWARELEREL